jgi:hypothetical protein
MEKWLLIFILAGSCLAADYYVSPSGTGTDGKSWQTAWSGLDKISWQSVNPGDTVWIDGGPGGITYASGLSVSKAGTSQARITIKRSTASGHDGKVTVQDNFEISAPYITIDGGDRDKFWLETKGGYGIRVLDNADYFVLRSVYLRGDLAYVEAHPDGWGTLFYSTSMNTNISHCGFYETNGEDQVKFNSAGKLVIEDSVFHGLRSIRDQHADAVQFDGPGGTDLVVRRNMFYDNPTDCFMLNDRTKLGNLYFSHNIFDGVADAVKFQEAESITANNNIFSNCRDIMGDADSIECVNNIYLGHSPWGIGNGVAYCGNIMNSIWDPGSPEFHPGNSNMQVSPQFVNADNILGTDGKAQTADDGYSLKSTSPAIDKGLSQNELVDIIGNPIKVVDIGPYEFLSGCNMVHEADNNPCDSCVMQDEMISYITKWKNSQAALANLMEAIRLWKSGC